MNGRAYDYNLGRFLSVDPFVQAPGNSQSMNPYSYIMNNPLAGTDPSGYEGVGIILEQNMMFENPEVAAELTEIRKEGVKGAYAAIVTTVIVADAVSDVVAPVKGIIKQGVKQVVKQVVKAVKNGKDNLVKTKDGKISEIGKTPPKQRPEGTPKRAGEVNEIQGPPNMTRSKTDGRHEADGKPGPRVKVDYADGTKKDITRDRVKETVPNNHPNNPKPGSPQKVKGMENPLNKDGSKRKPTPEEKKIVEDKRIKEN